MRRLAPVHPQKRAARPKPLPDMAFHGLPIPSRFFGDKRWGKLEQAKSHEAWKPADYRARVHGGKVIHEKTKVLKGLAAIAAISQRSGRQKPRRFSGCGRAMPAGPQRRNGKT